jgi:Gamma-glutamyl cyclotransferase, AIG2-like
MRFFFYGTLMDPDLLSGVLGRRIAPSALISALLRGYRRSAVRGANYPVVVRDEGAWVEGMVLSGVTIAERDHLVRYEGENYVLACALAEFPERPPEPVLFFEPRPGAVAATGEPWSLARWRLRDKSSAMKMFADPAAARPDQL